MREIDETTVAEYLRASGRIGAEEAVRARPLAGGVSNVVLLVERQESAVEPVTGGCSSPVPSAEHVLASPPAAPPTARQPLPKAFVIKQARGRLRVAEPWFCSVERIWREMDVLSACSHLLVAGAAGEEPPLAPLRTATPRLLFEDRANYLFAMSAIVPGGVGVPAGVGVPGGVGDRGAGSVPGAGGDRGHPVWKSQLLAGDFSPDVAAASGRLLGTLHAASWRDERLSESLGDRQYFESLRVDPYYRHLARRDATLAAAVERLVRSLEQHPCGLVHGDYSPKNLLVSADTLTLVDFEVGHYGDVSFDIGFLLSHLVLKTFHAGRRWPGMLPLIRCFWESYRARMATRLTDEQLRSVEARGLLHLAGCGLARLDGKSPVEYLRDEALRARIRRTFRAALESPIADWDAWERHLLAALPAVPPIS